MTGTIALIDAAEYDAATTKRVGRRTVPVALELPSGVLTGEPNRSGDGPRVALSHPWTEEDRLCMAEMFVSLVWVDTLPDDWAPVTDLPPA